MRDRYFYEFVCERPSAVARGYIPQRCGWLTITIVSAGVVSMTLQRARVPYDRFLSAMS